MPEGRKRREGEAAELQFDRVEDALEESTPVVGTGDVADADDGLTSQERYEGYLEAGVDPSGADGLDLPGARDLRSGETTDPELAAEEGLTWIPPTDPVVVPDDSPEGLRVASGFGTSATDEPFDADHHSELLPAEDEMTDRVREALRADAATSRYANSLRIDTEAGVVTVRGTVDDIVDTDSIVAVVAEVDGVTDIRDHLEVRGL